MNSTESRARTSAWLWGAAFLVLGVCGGLLAATWVMKLPERVLVAETQRGMKPPVVPQIVAPHAARPAQFAARPAVQRPTMAGEVFEKQVMRVVELEHSRNLAAIDTARRRLDEKFAGYAEKIPRFAGELNSLSIKYQILKAVVLDKVNSSHEMQQVATDLFGKDVVSDSQLSADIADVVEQFRRDLDANRALISTALGQEVVLPSISDPTVASSFGLLARESLGQLHKSIEARAEEVPAEALEALGSGVVAEEAIRKRVTEAIAARVAESSSGGAKNAEGAPKSATAGGIAAGLVAGAADYWLLEARFERALTKDCLTALDKMRDSLWADPRNGLEADFTGLADLASVSHEIALRKALQAGAL